MHIVSLPLCKGRWQPQADGGVVKVRFLLITIPQSLRDSSLYTREPLVCANILRRRSLSRSFAPSPHVVILERSEESRGATPLEDDSERERLYEHCAKPFYMC